VLGLGLVVLVIAVGDELSEPGAWRLIIERTAVGWLLVALALQILTYFAEGENWRVVLRARKHHVPIWRMWRLAMAKLFVDQAVPSAGLSGTAIIAYRLERMAIPRAVVMAAIVVDIASYYFSYFVCLILALCIAFVKGHLTGLVLLLTLLLLLAAALIVGTTLSVAGRESSRIAIWMQRVPLVRDGIKLLTTAERGLALSPNVLIKATVWQMGTVLCDTLTLWCLLISTGAEVGLPTVFASFMVSSLLRTVSIVPAGLGPFEAASVATLSLADVPIPVALSATLLFRLLSFWLPLLPGLIFARDAVKRARD
jgi:Mg2+-importing ATPase